MAAFHPPERPSTLLGGGEPPRTATMSSGTRDRPVVVVTGDITMDWNLAEPNPPTRLATSWTSDRRAKINFQPGGAYLLAELIRRSLSVDLRTIPGTAGSASRGGGVLPGDQTHHHSTAVWSLQRRTSRSADRVWRLSWFHGFARRSKEAPLVDEWSMVRDDPPEADIVVLDDANLGFREEESRHLWPRGLASEPSQSPPWIVLKTAWPIAKGALTDHLLEHAADRLIVVTTAADVRRSEVQVSSGLSWEASAQDLAWELTYNPTINPLSRAFCVIVSFGPAGAWISSAQPAPDGGEDRPSRAMTLVFDHTLIEGMWEQEHPGGVVGYTTSLTAAVVKAVAARPQHPDVVAGVQAGIAAMQALHEHGFDHVPGKDEISFPFDAVTKALDGARTRLGVVDVPLPSRAFVVAGAAGTIGGADDWSILRHRYRDRANLLDIAEDVVTRGPESVLTDVPLATFGDLVTADRQEIEGFRSIRNLIVEYQASRESRPLSIAVFGPPGSGKSFGVTQVARSVLEDTESRTFNLSQFEGPGELVGALHQVRDVGLSGKVPLVFWDEFDANLGENPLGWLRHFLVPMQDGKFYEGNVTHHIGRAIFVFAGGVARSLEHLGQDLDPDRWKAAKGPDFVSRLQGYINIVGTDRRGVSDGYDKPDPQYVIRRAIVLRSLLERLAPWIEKDPEGVVAIDPGLLRTFLEVWEYKHGVRSIESIIRMSQLAGRSSYQRSSLPSAEQLDLHVNSREFLALLVQQVRFEGALLERLAEANHEIYRAQQSLKQPPPPLATRRYDELTDPQKEMNCEAVRGIAYKLASIGFTYASTPDPDKIPLVEIPEDAVEALGKAEHDRWIVSAIDKGYVYGPERNERGSPKTHPDLVPWDALDERELARRYPPSIGTKLGPGPLKNEWDREMIRKIPHVLAKANLMLVQVSDL